MNRRISLLLVVLFALSLAGCAPPGTYRKVRNAIREAAVEELGPADRYDVSISRDPIQRLLDGRISDVTVHGVNVRPQPGYIIDDLVVHGRNVRFNRKAKTVEGADETDATGVIGDASLAAMLAEQGLIRNPVVHVLANGVEVSGEYSAFGGLPVYVTAFGNVSLAGPTSIQFTSTRVTAEGIPMPTTISRAIDFSRIYAPLVLTGVRTEPGRAILTGTIDWSKQ